MSYELRVISYELEGVEFTFPPLPLLPLSITPLLPTPYSLLLTPYVNVYAQVESRAFRCGKIFTKIKNNIGKGFKACHQPNKLQIPPLSRKYLIAKFLS
jgi:hypothetical protein